MTLHIIISRKEAKAQGLKRYFTGKPCKHGHIAERHMEGKCAKCAENWKKANPKYWKEWYVKVKKSDPDIVLKLHLKRKYGLSLDEFKLLSETQLNCCAICLNICTQYSRLSVDHSHSIATKKESVRGLLCVRCNTSLQGFKDSPELLEQAAQYLRSMPAQKVLKAMSKAA
jgi:hypothetical protein